MPTVSYKPTSAGRRFMTTENFEEMTATNRPYEGLVKVGCLVLFIFYYLVALHYLILSSTLNVCYSVPGAAPS